MEIRPTGPGTAPPVPPHQPARRCSQARRRGAASCVDTARSVDRRITPRQLEVLRWIADGCPHRNWPNETHKNTARALASRGLAAVGRKQKVWTAEITEAGSYYLTHGHPMPRTDDDLEPVPASVEPRRRGRPPRRRRLPMQLDVRCGESSPDRSRPSSDRSVRSRTRTCATRSSSPECR